MKNTRFNLTIKTTNEAFSNGTAYEVVRILRNLADRIEEGKDDYRLMDINGNAVGEASFK